MPFVSILLGGPYSIPEGGPWHVVAGLWNSIAAARADAAKGSVQQVGTASVPFGRAVLRRRGRQAGAYRSTDGGYGPTAVRYTDKRCRI